MEIWKRSREMKDKMKKLNIYPWKELQKKIRKLRSDNSKRMAEIFPELMKDMSPQIQKSNNSEPYKKINKFTSRHKIEKLQSRKTERMLKGIQNKAPVIYKGKIIRPTANFSVATLMPWNMRIIFSKWWEN